MQEACVEQRDRIAQPFQWQFDEEDGGWLSPTYSVPSNPSILYEPPGHRIQDRMRSWHNNLYDRMDPLSALRLHTAELEAAVNPTWALTSVGPSILQERAIINVNADADADATTNGHETVSTTTSENRPYTQSEVLAALVSPQSRPVAGVPASRAQDTINSAWRLAGEWTQQGDAVAASNDRLRAEVGRARTELRDLRLCVDHILAGRQLQRRLARQNRRIMRQVSGHIRELRYEYLMRGQQLGEAMGAGNRLVAEWHMVRAELQTEVARAGLESVEAVRAEVGDEFLRRLEDLPAEPESR